MIMRALLSVLLLLLALFPRSCYGWTDHEWVGVIEAVAGTVVLKAGAAPSSDVCDNCGGTGKLGDGTVSVKCPICDGTGKPTAPTKTLSGTIDSNQPLSGMGAPTVEHDAIPRSGGSYKKRWFRRK